VQTFTKIVLYTDATAARNSRRGRAARRRHSAGDALGGFRSSGYQLRHSPVGFRSQWHCTPQAQWVFILQGEMEIGLRDGTSRIFRPGEHFYAADLLPEASTFDADLHGHWSAQRGSSPLVTLFLKT
jgi:hypothetical protein